eukprot:Amastigsp_a4440_101.p3 type:complete len:139 gc:universal Amastigsp_a4440_101:823-407(-)
MDPAAVRRRRESLEPCARERVSIRSLFVRRCVQRLPLVCANDDVLPGALYVLRRVEHCASDRALPRVSRCASTAHCASVHRVGACRCRVLDGRLSLLRNDQTMGLQSAGPRDLAPDSRRLDVLWATVHAPRPCCRAGT